MPVLLTPFFLKILTAPSTAAPEAPGLTCFYG